MTEKSVETTSDRTHWFVERDLDVVLFKVNRRALPAYRDTLLDELSRADQPTDPLQHFIENLSSYNPTAESGRRHKRTWLVGNLSRTRAGDVVVGRLGWQRSGSAVSTIYDESSQLWIDREEPRDVSAVAPFALIADGRILGVLRHPTFLDTTIAQVLTDLLNSSERNRASPTTDFDVEPVGDSQRFFEWLDGVDRVTKVEFVFKRPNPDGEAAFQELFDRQDEFDADEIRETVRADADGPGLNKQAFQTDRVAQAFLAAALAAYGFVVARGWRNGRQARFDQRAKVAKEAVAGVGDTWEDATQKVVEATQRGRRKRAPDG